MRRRLAMAALLLPVVSETGCRNSAGPPAPAGAPSAASAPARAPSTSARIVATLLEPGAGREPAADSGRVGRVDGVARWEGSTPLKVKQLTNDLDVEVCGARVNTGSMVAGPGGELANVVIELRPLDEARRAPGEPLVPPDAPPVTAVLSRCLQDPHVLVVPLGASVEVINEDDLLHELAGTCIRNAPFEASLPRYRRRALVAATELARPERIKVSCRTHPWSVCWWVVTGARHHAVTGRDGRFRLDGVPAGTWRLLAWHEELGETERTVDVRADATATAVVAWR